MKRSLTAILTTFPLLAQANDGPHLHPHGIQFGWIIAAVLCGLGGYALARWHK